MAEARFFFTEPVQENIGTVEALWTGWQVELDIGTDPESIHFDFDFI